MPIGADNPAVRRAVRRMDMRGTHSWWLGFGDEIFDGEVGELSQLLKDHNLEVLDEQPQRILAKQRGGREYELTREVGGRWRYTTVSDPIHSEEGRVKVVKPQRSLDFRQGVGGDTRTVVETVKRDPLWWDGKTFLSSGTVMSFDFEGSREDWDFSHPVLVAFGTDAGDAIVVDNVRVVDFMLGQHQFELEQTGGRPLLTWCGWNISGADIPVLDCRLAGFREQIHPLLMERLKRGWLYDTMLLAKLLDVARLGEVYSRKRDSLFPSWWAFDPETNQRTGAYTLGTQTRRYLGIELSKKEQLSFKPEHVRDPFSIRPEQLAYAATDAIVEAVLHRVVEDRLTVEPEGRKLTADIRREIVKLKGVVLDLQVDAEDFENTHGRPPVTEDYGQLYHECGMRFGWGTHRIQFLGAYGMAWAGPTGIEIDIDGIFKLLEDYEKELDVPFLRLAGRSGRPIVENSLEKGPGAELAWVPDGSGRSADQEALEQSTPEMPAIALPTEHLNILRIGEKFLQEEADAFNPQATSERRAYPVGASKHIPQRSVLRIGDLLLVTQRVVDDYDVKAVAEQFKQRRAEDATAHTQETFDPGDVVEWTEQGWVWLHGLERERWWALTQQLEPYKFADIKKESVSMKDLRDYAADYLIPKLPPEQFKKIQDRMGLQEEAWCEAYDVQDGANIADPILALFFGIASKRKTMAMVKSYLPGYKPRTASDEEDSEDEDNKELANLSLGELRRRLQLVGVSRGRLHPSFISFEAATTRSASRNPNLQQVSTDKRQRSLFVAASARAFSNNDIGSTESMTCGEITARRYPDLIAKVAKEMDAALRKGEPRASGTLEWFINHGYDPHFLTGFNLAESTRIAEWFPILSDPLIRHMKQQYKPALTLQALNAVLEKYPDYKYKKGASGEDLAKNLWTMLLAKQLYPDLEKEKGEKKVSGIRQNAKPVNFGAQGGMKANRLRTMAKVQYGIDMSEAQSKAAFEAWRKTWLDGARWLDDGKQYLVPKPPFPWNPTGYYTMSVSLTGGLRGKLPVGDSEDYDTGLNEWHNTQFQKLAADGIKLGLYLVVWEGIAPVNFVHDEIDTEPPIAVATEYQDITVGSLVYGFEQVVRLIYVSVGSKISDRWTK